MALIGFTSSIVFATGRPLAAAEINVLRENAAVVDMLSYRGRRAFTNQTYRLDDYGLDPSPLGGASFQFRTGMTTATFMFGSDTAGHTLNIYMNEVLRYTGTLPAGGSFVNITISGLGFTDLQIVDCRIEVDHSGTAGNYEWYDAYVGPCSAITLPTGSWPGVPTFGSLSAANLNQLANALSWLMERMTAVVQPAFQSQQYRNAPFWVTTLTLWSGSIARANGADRLRIPIGYYAVTNQAERLQIYFNGSLVATGPTWVAGQSGSYEFDISLASYGDGTAIDVRVDHVVLTAESAGVRPHPSRYIVADVYTTRASFPYATPATLSVPRESLTFSSLQTRLNAIGTIATNAYTRVTGNADVFDRARMFRHRPVLDAGQNSYFAQLYVARGRRAHDALWLRGKGIKLAYGPRTVTASLDDPYEYEFAHAEQVGQSENVEDSLVYFDSFEGLFPGMDWYAMAEDVRFAGEQLR